MYCIGTPMTCAPPSVKIVGNMPKGWADKLYWRPVAGAGWHCFKKTYGGGYGTLCGCWHKDRSGGQACRRPERERRCPTCESAEMKRRKWDKPGPMNVYPDQQERFT